MTLKNYDTRSQATQTWLLQMFYENLVFLTTQSALYFTCILTLYLTVLKNIILAFLENSPSTNAGKKIWSLSFCLFLKLLWFKNAISFRILKKIYFSPFSEAYYMIVFFKNFTSYISIQPTKSLEYP